MRIERAERGDEFGVGHGEEVLWHSLTLCSLFSKDSLFLTHLLHNAFQI